MDSFDDAFAALMQVEKGYQDDPADSGNWTSGRVGVGSCRGTKYGISSAAYPDLDIKSLTVDQAKALAKRDYWDKFQCDQFDGRIGFQLFDIAYNGGHPVLWLQQAVGVKPDGVIGDKTVGAVTNADPLKIMMRINAYRLNYMAGLPLDQYDDGWMRRIATNLLRGAE